MSVPIIPNIGIEDSNTMSPDGEIAVDFWFEDTLGRRYIVKNAKENLKKFWEKN